MSNQNDYPVAKLKQYTVKEIDALRIACELRWLYGTTNRNKFKWSRQYMESELTSGVEQLVRTFMLAGLTAQDIYNSDE